MLVIIITIFDDHVTMNLRRNLLSQIYQSFTCTKLLLNTTLHFFLFSQLGFTPCKAELSLQGMELQEKEPQKD